MARQIVTELLARTGCARRWLPRCGRPRSAARASGRKSTAGTSAARSSRPNRCEDRVNRRLRQYQTGKRKVVVVIRERGENGKTLSSVFPSEIAALNFIRTTVASQTELFADEAASWSDLHARFTLRRS